MNQYCELSELGWSDWFAQRADCKPPDTVARVAAVDRDQLLLVDQDGNFRAKLAGRYLHHHHLNQELPCVGDWVCVEKQSGDDFGVSLPSSIPLESATQRGPTATPFCWERQVNCA